MGCFSWFWSLFGGSSGKRSKKVGPKASTAMDFDGIDPSNFELKCLAKLLSRDFVRGTPDRWKVTDQKMRQDLAVPGEAKWEDTKAYSAKSLLTKSKQVYALRRDHVQIPASELARLMKSMDRLILGPGEQSANTEAEVQAANNGDGEGAAAATPAVAPDAAAAASDKANKKKKKGGKDAEDNSERDYSAAALKLVSMDERASLDLRAEGFEYGEIDLESFFTLLYRLKFIHGHFWPPKKDSNKEAEINDENAEQVKKKKKKKKKKKGDADDDANDSGMAVADSFYDLGCGGGKLMFAAALFFDFASCSGTELMGGLCSAATDLSTRWKEDLAPTLSEEKGKVEIEVETNDLMKSAKWEKSSYFLVNGPTFPETLMDHLATKANGKNVRSESIAIVVARPWTQLEKDKWVLIAEDEVLMSWGKTSKVYVYEKLPEKKTKAS